MQQTISLKDTIVSLIESIDLFNYLLKNHHRRVAIIAYNLGTYLSLSKEQIHNLVLAASLHDIGALSIEERNQLIQMDVENPRHHEIIGSAMLSSFEPFVKIAKIIAHHHIHWSDVGITIDKSEVPLESYVLHVADRIDILINTNEDIHQQLPTIIKTIVSYSGTLFAPWVIDGFKGISVQEAFWMDIDYKSFNDTLVNLIGDSTDILLTSKNLEQLALTFSRIVDFRSRFTLTHSLGVGTVAYQIGLLFGLDEDTCGKLKIAGFLHDIGKIGVPNELIEKKSSLTESEYDQVKTHSYYTYVILSKIKGFEDICNWASKHHEKHDKSGYPFHIDEHEFSIEIDILAFADIFTSLCEDRPYRLGIDSTETLEVLKSYVPDKLSKNIYTIIKENFYFLNGIRVEAQLNGEEYYTRTIQNNDSSEKL